MPSLPDPPGPCRFGQQLQHLRQEIEIHETAFKVAQVESGLRRMGGGDFLPYFDDSRPDMGGIPRLAQSGLDRGLDARDQGLVA